MIAPPSPRLVVDAAIAVKWAVAEVDSAAAEALYDSDVELFAPDLLPIEFGNALWKKVQRGQLQPDESQRILAAFQRNTRIGFVPVSGLLGHALTIALQYQRTVYDSLYLALAVEQDCAMITTDERLYNRLQGTEMEPFVVTLGRY